MHLKSPRDAKKLHEELARNMHNAVVGNIGMTTERHTGDLQRWQKAYVGSGGGYAAVRAEDTSTGANSPGAVTNYVNSGHKIRRAANGMRGRRKRRIRVAYVDGRYFYQSAARDMESALAPLAEKFVRDIASIIEGK